MAQTTTERPASELEVSYWIDTEGMERAPVTLKELGARHRLRFFYQHRCPGCHSHGFPTVQTLVFDPRTKDVRFAVVQAIFEGTPGNTPDMLPLDQQRYGLWIPFGHKDRSSLGAYPTTIKSIVPAAHRSSLSSNLTEWSFRMDSTSTSISLSERSLKRSQSPGDVCDACAFSPFNERTGVAFAIVIARVSAGLFRNIDEIKVILAKITLNRARITYRIICLRTTNPKLEAI